MKTLSQSTTSTTKKLCPKSCATSKKSKRVKVEAETKTKPIKRHMYEGGRKSTTRQSLIKPEKNHRNVPRNQSRVRTSPRLPQKARRYPWESQESVTCARGQQHSQSPLELSNMKEEKSSKCIEALSLSQHNTAPHSTARGPFSDRPLRRARRRRRRGESKEAV